MQEFKAFEGELRSSTVGPSTEQRLRNYYQRLMELIPVDSRPRSDLTSLAPEEIDELYMAIRSYLASKGVLIFYEGSLSKTLIETSPSGQKSRKIFIHHTLSDRYFLVRAIGPHGMPIVYGRDAENPGATGLTANGIPFILGDRLDEMVKIHSDFVSQPAVKENMRLFEKADLWQAIGGVHTTDGRTHLLSVNEWKGVIGFANLKLYAMKSFIEDMAADEKLLTAYHEEQH